MWLGIKYGIGLFTLAVLLSACGSSTEAPAGQRLLARVHNKSLYLSDLEGMFPQFATSEDSLLVIRAFTDRWVREAVLLYEAEKNLPAGLNIDKLVRDYRASLVRSNYERVLVEQLLDSTVTQAELQAFYDQHKEQYQLETPILRCYFLKVPIPAPDANRLQRLWNGKRAADTRLLKQYGEQYAKVALLNDSLWYSLNEVSRLLPNGTITSENLSAKQEFTLQDGEYLYYFRLFERKNRQDIAPLGYIQEQARKVILHVRKQQLLEDVKQDMYDQELRRNNIEILID